MIKSRPDRHFSCQKNGERRRTCRGVARRAKTEGFTSLCRQAQLHSKNKVFSSLPRRNAMKPDEVFSLPPSHKAMEDKVFYKIFSNLYI